MALPPKVAFSTLGVASRGPCHFKRAWSVGRGGGCLWGRAMQEEAAMEHDARMLVLAGDVTARHTDQMNATSQQRRGQMNDLGMYMSMYDSDSSGADQTHTRPDSTPPDANAMGVHRPVAASMAVSAVTVTTESAPAVAPALVHAGAASRGLFPASLPSAAMQEERGFAHAVQARVSTLPAFPGGIGGGCAGGPGDSRLRLHPALPPIMIRGAGDTDAWGVDNTLGSTSTSINRQSPPASQPRLRDADDGAAELVDEDEDDDAGAVIRGPVHKWCEHARCTGWASAMTTLAALEVIHCPGLKFAQGSYNLQRFHVDYRFHCPYAASCHCRWKCRVRVLFGKNTPATCVKAESREQFHAMHRCLVQICLDFEHSGHSEPVGEKVPMLWKAYANQFNAALESKRHEIAHWLHKHNIPDQHGAIAKKIARYNQRQRKELQLPDADVASTVKEHGCRTTGSDYVQAKQYDFDQICQSDTFGPDTPHLIPGWSIDGSDLLDIQNPWAKDDADDIVKHSLQPSHARTCSHVR